MKIWFDMDGTIADLYAVEGWLEDLRNFNPCPYLLAKPMVRMSQLARAIHKAQAQGHEVGIISWSSKVSNEVYDNLVEEAKRQWLVRHLPSVHWDEIHVVPYGTPKHEVCQGILIDDEAANREAWKQVSGNWAYSPETIFAVLEMVACFRK